MDDIESAANHVLHHALTLAVRADSNNGSSPGNSSSSASSDSTANRPPTYKVVGIVLAVCSGLFIGVSFVIKKIGLLKANEKYHEEAGEGYGYLKNAWWWTGMTLMIIGEICNFVAYAFTEAILVTPLGALSVVVTTILSAIFLKERLSFVGKVACGISILGSVVIVLNAPEQAAVADIQQMQHYVITPGFLSYAGVIIVGCLCVIFFVAPKYGKKSMLVYLTICSLIGGLSVVATQGLGSAILAQINGKQQFNQWFLYVLFVFVIGTLLTEIIYLNKALNLFNAALVTPTYYVYFTSSTIVASAVLFQGFHGTATEIVDVVLGFLVICSGVILLQLAKSSKDVPDAAVLKGDLDQVREVAEQEEPEYEPRADTIRGGAAIVRAMSKVRTKRQADDVRKMHEESMQSVGEGETLEWDGLRRRRTTSTAHTMSVKRTKTAHPPLGMSHFPDDAVSEADSDAHPGFFFSRRGRRSQAEAAGSQRTKDQGHSPVPLGSIHVTPNKTDSQSSREHTFGLPPGLQKPSPSPYSLQQQDTAYHGSGTGPGHIHFAENNGESRTGSRSSSLAPPRPPPHVSPTTTSTPAHMSSPTTTARRQFSFQNPFHRHRADSTDTANNRPTSRGALSFISGASREHGPNAHTFSYPGTAGDGATEEERAGLVQGDSERILLPRYGNVPLSEEPEPEDEEAGRRGMGTVRERERERGSSEEWQLAELGSSPESPSLGDLGGQWRR